MKKAAIIAARLSSKIKDAPCTVFMCGGGSSKTPAKVLRSSTPQASRETLAIMAEEARRGRWRPPEGRKR